jgi:hypothetical protein
MSNFDGRAIGAALTSFKKSWAKGVCLHPEAPTNCNGKPIDSHTIQRGRSLDAIATYGHVLQVKVDPAALFKLRISRESLGHPVLDIIKSHKDSRNLEATRIGLRDASIFPGFCGWHDNATFVPIEEVALTFTEEQCFLFTYRPACFELWAKRCKVRTTETALQENSSEYLELIKIIDDLALSEHLERKVRLDQMLLTRDYSDLHFLVLELDANPGVATTGVFAPEVDFEDNPLQGIGDLDTPLQHVSYAIIPEGDRGFVLIGWEGDQPAVEQFVDSLLGLNPSLWADAVLTVAFESIENTFFSEVFWEALSPSQKMWITLRTLTGGLGLRPISYKPDGIGIASQSAHILIRK